MIRTPFGRAGQRGVFRDISHVEMVVPLMKNVLDRNNIGGEEVDEVLWGSVGIAGMLTRSRLYVLEAGLPHTISATDMNKQCGSSLQASAQAAFAVMAGMSDVVIAGGVETMDRVNPIPPGDETNLQQVQTAEVMAKEFLQPWPDKDKAPVWAKRWYQVTEPWIMDMGQTAEKLAAERGVSREDADRFSLESHKKTIRAQKEGLLADEINPIEISYSDGSSVTVDTDQNPRENTSLEKLASLKPAYTADGQVTAGNASPRTDGATICLIMEKEMAKEKGLKPLATIRHAASVGVDPTIMGIGPVPATQKLLKRSGMTLDDFDIIEINEA
ncbi:MAG: thiolase family protein, partial [Chloroflexi bacterium]|nr:thiolase family protein [Chloroflexota bacterium]